MNFTNVFKLLGPVILLAGCASSKKNPVAMQTKPDTVFLHQFLKQNPAFENILLHNDAYRVQIIYTRIDRNKRNKPHFQDFTFNNNKDIYYYPASTVKLPIALLALQKLKELNIKGLDKNTTMITDSAFAEGQQVFNDATAADGRPTVAQYIKRILLVSDNEACNRLYEFLGQEYINNNLHKMGYDDAQIIHRLDISLTEEQNRTTNPVKFYDTAGRLIYEKPLQKSGLVYAQRNDFLGKGYFSNNVLKMEPFNFSKKNRLALADLHSIVKSIFFPSSVAKNQQFDITEEDRLFVQKYMSMLPRESDYPYYDPAIYADDHVKLLFYGSRGSIAEPDIRIFNKEGDAYGFLIDGAYIVDYKNEIEFLLSAVIHCNSDGIYNDDHYDYQQTGFPFMKNLGRAIYQYELNRARKNDPDLSAIHFNYTQHDKD
jgi:hypothetical protein